MVKTWRPLLFLSSSLTFWDYINEDGSGDIILSFVRNNSDGSLESSFPLFTDIFLKSELIKL